MNNLSNRAKVKILNKTIDNQDYQIGDFVISGSWGGDLGTPADQFQLTLLPLANKKFPVMANNLLTYWKKTINKGDVITIGVEQEDSFLYRIDSIIETKTISQSSSTKVLTLAGRGFAGLLIDDDIVMAPELASNKQAKELLKDRAQFLGLLRGLGGDESKYNQFIDKNPAAVILWIMINMPSIRLEVPEINFDTNGKMLSYKVETIGKYFAFDFKTYRPDTVFNFGMNQFSGKIWNYLLQCIDPMFYEMFVETVSQNGCPRAQLVVRPKPFDRSTDTERVRSDVISIKMEDFTTSEEEVESDGAKYNHVFVDLPKEKAAEMPATKWFWNNDVECESKFLCRIPYNKNDKVLGISDYKTEDKIPKSYHHFHELDSEFRSSIGSSLNEVFNFFTMHSSKEILSTTSLARLGYLFPLVDTYSIQKFGMRKLAGMSNLYKVSDLIAPSDVQKQLFDNPDKIEAISTLSEQVALRDRLFNWNRYNPVFESGDIECKGHDYYRKGDKLYAPLHMSKSGRLGVFYYITGVRFEYSATEAGTSYKSLLKVERGENPEDLSQYRILTGYDLFDRGLMEEPVEGDALGTTRKNPVIKIDVVFSQTMITEAASRKLENEKHENKDASNTLTEETKTKTKSRKVGKRTIVGSNTDDTGTNYKGNLTEASKNQIRDGFNTYKSSYAQFGVKSHKELEDWLQDSGDVNSINPNVYVALIIKESSFNPKAISNTGCSGLGQFEIKTAKGQNSFSGGRYYIQLKGNNFDDIRFNPKKSIYAMGECLTEKGYHQKGKGPKYAVQSYCAPNVKVAYYNDFKNILLNLWEGYKD